MKSRRLDDRLLLRRCGPAQRGPEPGEELVHPERLGDVVVGAGVERGDLVLLASRADSTTIGTVAPAAQAADHLDAVDAGQPEVEHDHVGMVARRELERLLAGRARGRPRSRAPGG